MSTPYRAAFRIVEWTLGLGFAAVVVVGISQDWVGAFSSRVGLWFDQAILRTITLEPVPETRPFLLVPVPSGIAAPTHAADAPDDSGIQAESTFGPVGEGD